jgi:hypothetical protein
LIARNVHPNRRIGAVALRHQNLADRTANAGLESVAT